MRVIILATIIFISSLTFAQDPGFSRVDYYVDGLELDKSISVDDLVITITKPFDSPTSKTMAIYYWIAKNIRYDHTGYKTNFWTNYPSSKDLIADTYKFRKGVCSGYSYLFEYMLAIAKIESKVIDGYSRADFHTVITDEPNHTWNAVKLNEKWYLFDVTWASDTMNRGVDSFWFKTSPEIFALNHYPENPRWTLLGKNISLNEFKNSPVYTRSVMEMGIVKRFSQKGHYQTGNDTISIEFSTTKECLWLAKLYDIDKAEWFSPVSLQDSAFEKGFINLAIDRKGKFILQLNALETGDGSFTIHNDLVYYLIECK